MAEEEHSGKASVVELGGGKWLRHEAAAPSSTELGLVSSNYQG